MVQAPGRPRLCAGSTLLLALFALVLCVKYGECQCANITYTPTPAVKPNIEVQAPDGASAFLFFAAPVSWCTAEASCKGHGGHLASVLTKTENDLVVGTCFNKLLSGSDPQAGCWIGLNDIAQEGNYTWSDGSSVYYTDWYSGSDFRQPDDATQPDNEDCVFAFKAYGGWHDRDCNAAYAYVCRVPASAGTNKTAAAQAANTEGAAATITAATEGPMTPATPNPAGTAAPSLVAQAPPPSPPPSSGTDWRIIVATVAPILTGVAALVAIAYTGWKWWHKRQATLARKQAAPQTGKQLLWDNGVSRAGVKPVDVV